MSQPDPTGNDALNRAVKAINSLTYDELQYQREQTEQYRQIARRWETAFWVMIGPTLIIFASLWGCYAR